MIGVVISICLILIACNVFYETDETDETDQTEEKIDVNEQKFKNYLK